MEIFINIKNTMEVYQYKTNSATHNTNYEKLSLLNYNNPGIRLLVKFRGRSFRSVQ